MWYELQLGEVYNAVKEEDVMEGEEVQSQRTTVVWVEANTLH